MKVKTILATVLSAVIKVAVIIWIVTFIYSKAVAAYEFGHRVFTEEAISPAPGREITVSVTEGKSSKDLAKMLAEKGLVRDANLAYVQILCSEYRKEIKPGVYTLTTAMRIEEMLEIMAASEEEEEKNDG